MNKRSILCLILFQIIVASGQAQKAKTYFTDATATHLPLDADLHSLGSAMADMDKGGDLDIVIAVEYGVNRLYINDGSGKFSNDGKGYFSDQTNQYIPVESKGRGWGMSRGDVDGDGKDDLFIGGWGTQARLLLTKK